MANNIPAFLGWRTSDLQNHVGTNAGSPTSGSGTLTVPLDGTSYQQTDRTFNNSPANKAVRWALLASHKITGDIGAGAEYIFLAPVMTGASAYFLISAVRVDASTYNVRVATNNSVALAGETVRFTGATAFSFNTAYSLLAYTNGSTFYLEVGGILQGSYATTDVIATMSGQAWQLGSTSATAAGVNFIAGALAYATTDALAEKPDVTTLNVAAYDPDKTASPRTPVTGCDEFNIFPNTGETKEDDSDDYITGNNDGDTTYVADPGTANTTFRQTHRTIRRGTAPANPQVLALYSAERSTAAAKTINGYPIIGHTGNDNYREGASDFAPSDTAWHYPKTLFQNNVANTAWTVSDLTNLQIGRRSTIGTQAVNQRVTTVMAEVASLIFAPPVQSYQESLSRPRREVVGY